MTDQKHNQQAYMNKEHLTWIDIVCIVVFVWFIVTLCYLPVILGMKGY